MHTHHSFHKLLLLFMLFLFGGLAACNGEDSGPRAWIDFPRDGAAVPSGAAVTVISHAYAQDGVSEVLLLVNGEPYRRDPPGTVRESVSEVRQEWFTGEPGLYTLQVRSYDSAGGASNPSSITVRVVGEVAEAPVELPADEMPTLTATAIPAVPEDSTGPSPTKITATPRATLTPTFTPTAPPPPTQTSTATSTPVPTFTSTAAPPPAPTFTSTAPPQAEVAFWADNLNITDGECTILRWEVTNGTAIFLDGQAVASQATRTVCPEATTTYLLHVEALSGSIDRSVTVNVSAAVDTTPPPAPVPVVPADELVLSCRATQVLAWLPVEDASGIAGYELKLEHRVTTDQWNTVDEWGPVVDKQSETDVQCGLIYRWAVRALDGAGNTGEWSEWFHFSIALE